MSKLDRLTFDEKPSITRLNSIEGTVSDTIKSHTKLVNQDFNAGSFDFSYFFELVDRVLQLQQSSEGIQEDKRLLFVEDNPSETIETRAITYFLKSRVPGRMDRGPAGIGGIKAVKPILKQQTDHPDMPGEVINTYIQPYDNWVTFHVYARSAKVAMETMLWLENTMLVFDQIFRDHGFQVIHEGVGDREVLEHEETLKLIRYPMSFFVRHGKLFNVSTQTLKSISIKPGIKID
jgi:hypothetical protein